MIQQLHYDTMLLEVHTVLTLMIVLRVYIAISVYLFDESLRCSNLFVGVTVMLHSVLLSALMADVEHLCILVVAGACLPVVSPVASLLMILGWQALLLVG